MNALADSVRSFPGSVTVCDPAGIIVALNAVAVRAFAADGGEKLLGQNVLDCHPEPSRSQLAELLRTRGTHVYTIEKQGVRKLVHQDPWYCGAEYTGLVELVVEIPANAPHFVRAGS